MFPSYDVNPRINTRANSHRGLTAEDIVEGFSLVRDYEPQVHVTWDEAAETLEAEARWLRIAAQAETADEFDRILNDAPEIEVGDDGDYAFRGLDVGVTGLTLILSAAHFATCYSCRGHAGPAVSNHPPQVRLAADRERLDLLIDYAERAGCGVDNDHEGLVVVYAMTSLHLHELAKQVAADRSRFEAIDEPDWLAPALEARHEDGF